MGKKHRILFSAPALYGHIGPSLAIAKHLKANGHTVGYTAGSSAQNMVEKIGIYDFYPRDKYHAASLDKATFGRSVFKYWYNLPKVFTPDIIKHCLKELIAAFEAFNPDVVYIDTYDVLAEAVAERFNVPYAHGSATTILYLEKDIPPIGTGWDIDSLWLNRLKWIPYSAFVIPFMLKTLLNQKKALKAIDPTWKKKNITGLSPYLYMLFSTDKLEYPRKMYIPQVFYVGPSIMKPDEDQLPDFPWEKIDNNRPLVYIATGTMFIDFYRDFYKNAIEALSSDNFPIPVQVVMAMGTKQLVNEVGEPPSNFIVVPYAPQIKLLQKASVFVTHGGVNSVNEALIFGKPLLVVHCGGDRVDMAKRVEHFGSGICLDVKHATVERIRSDVMKLLKGPAYTKGAKVIMDSLVKCNGAKTAADLMLRLADTGKPILRKKDAPITLEKIEDLSGFIE